MKINMFISVIVSAATILASCSRSYSEFTDTPIIESYLIPGDYFNLKVSRQLPFSSDVIYSKDNIDSLSITVKNDGNTNILTPAGEGKYVDSTLIVKENTTYEISFTFNSRHVSAYTHIPAKPASFDATANSISITRMDSTSTPGPGPGGFGEMPDPVTLTWNNDDASYYIVVVENIEDTLDPVRDFGDSDRPKNMFRKMPTNASGLQLRPQEFQYFGRHRLILYHVLPDYASLYSQGSNSSLNLTNPSTSISNGYGIFTGMNSDTLLFTVKEKTK
jgi:hypothetical protein